MSVNSRLKVTKIIGQREAFYRPRIPDSSCARKKLLTYILVTSKDGDGKIMNLSEWWVDLPWEKSGTSSEEHLPK